MKDVLSKHKAIAFATILTAAYLVIGAIGIAHHEMWNDEFQAWLIARDSSSIPQLLQNIRSEGSGPLWYFLLLPLTKITHEPAVMQVLHLVLAAACVFVVTRYSSLTWYQKLMFPFGYFVLFEYGMISRCYVLGNLLLFVFCALYYAHRSSGENISRSEFAETSSLVSSPPIAQKDRRDLRDIFVVLALLASTSVYGIMLAMALGAGILVQFFSVKERWTAAKSNPKFWSLVICVALAMTLPVVSLIPKESGFKAKIATLDATKLATSAPILTQSFSRSVGTVLYAYVPIPSDSYNFWETSWFRPNYYSLPAHWAILSAALFLFFLYSFRKSPMVFTSYALGTIGMVVFSFLIFTGSMRHYGQMFMLLVASMWLAPLPRQKSCELLFTALLAVHVVFGIYCYSLDILYPFSQSRQLAEFLKQNNLQQAPVCSHSFFGIGICALLDRQVYVMDRKEMGSFQRFVKFKRPSAAELEDAVKTIGKPDKPVLVLSPIPLEQALCPRVELQLIKSFEGSIMPTEDRFLYWARVRGEQAKPEEIYRNTH